MLGPKATTINIILYLAVTIFKKIYDFIIPGNKMIIKEKTIKIMPVFNSLSLVILKETAIAY